MTREKMFGKYCHNLLVHAPIQNRLNTCKSKAAENQERSFNAIQDITLRTSNRKPGHVIGNKVVRLQAEAMTKEKYEFTQTDDLIPSEIIASPDFPFFMNILDLIIFSNLRYKAKLLIML